MNYMYMLSHQLGYYNIESKRVPEKKQLGSN